MTKKSIAESSKNKTDGFIDLDGLTLQDLKIINNMSIDFLVAFVSFPWLVLTFFISIPFVLSFTECRKTDWIYALFSFIGICFQWIFMKKKGKIWKKLLKTALIPLLLTIPVASLKWSVYIGIVVIINILLIYLCLFFRKARSKSWDTRESLNVKIQWTFLITFIVFLISSILLADDWKSSVKSMVSSFEITIN